MNLDKRHLIASVVLLVGALAYNIWVFTRPAAGTRVTAGVPMGSEAPRGRAEEPVAAAVDPMAIAEPPDVKLDQLPEWSRDPFASMLASGPQAVEAGPEEAPLPDPDPVVASILYSEARRLAMVNGRIVRVGDQVGADRIIEIRPDAVVVESPTRGRRTLMLRSPNSTVQRQ